MRNLTRSGWVAVMTGVFAVLGASEVSAQTQAKNTDLVPGNTKFANAQALESGWGLGPYACGMRASGPLASPLDTVVIFPTSGSCNGREVLLTFSGPNLSLAHFMDYTVTCNTDLPKIEHTMGICDTDGGVCPQIPINRGVFTFPLSGGDSITVTTSETGAPPPGGTGVPALGEWGGIILGVGLAALAVLLILRRSA